MRTYAGGSSGGVGETLEVYAIPARSFCLSDGGVPGEGRGGYPRACPPHRYLPCRTMDVTPPSPIYIHRLNPTREKGEVALLGYWS